MNKYQEALDTLKSECTGSINTEALNTLQELIEKFDNPPLKFEQLENLKEQAIWDEKEKRYILFESARHNYVHYYGTPTTIYGVPFEENRFYRYEVKYDE